MIERFRQSGGMFGLLRSTYLWLVNRPSYMLLTAGDERLAAQPSQRFAGAWAGVMLLSLGCSVLLFAAASWSWLLFHDFSRLIMPSLAATVTFALWPFRRGMAALAETIAGDDPTARALTASVLVLVLMMCLLRINPVNHHEYSLRGWLVWLRPENEFFRLLLLMPLWGGWEMLIAAQLGKVGDVTEPAVAAFARGCGPVPMVVSLAAVLVITIQYFNFLPWAQVSISAAAIIAATVGGAGLCRSSGGLTRRALLAGNVLTQFVFLLAYLVVRNLRLW